MSLYQLSSGTISQGQDVTQIVNLLSGATAGTVEVQGRIQASLHGSSAQSGIYGGLYTTNAATGWPYPVSTSVTNRTHPYPAAPLYAYGSFLKGDLVSDSSGLMWLCLSTGVSTNTWGTVGNGGPYVNDRMYTSYHSGSGMPVNNNENTPIFVHDSNFSNPQSATAAEVQTGSFSAFYCMTPGYYLTGGRLSAACVSGSSPSAECDIHIDQNVSGQPYGHVTRTTTGEHYLAWSTNSGNQFGNPGGSVIDLVQHASGDIWTVGITVTGTPSGARTETPSNQSMVSRCFSALMWATETQ